MPADELEWRTIEEHCTARAGASDRFPVEQGQHLFIINGNWERWSHLDLASSSMTLPSLTVELLLVRKMSLAYWWAHGVEVSWCFGCFKALSGATTQLMRACRWSKEARELRRSFWSVPGFEQFVGSDLWSDDDDDANGWPYFDIPPSPCEVVGPISLQDIQNGQKLVGRRERFVCQDGHYATCRHSQGLIMLFIQTVSANRGQRGIGVLASDPGQAWKRSWSVDGVSWLTKVLSTKGWAFAGKAREYGRVPQRQNAAVVRADGDESFLSLEKNYCAL
jgi:hypothetical protein